MTSTTTIYGKHYLYPSALYASTSPTKITTVLGTCVAVCLFDKKLRIGGINHYMLPLWNGDGLASPKHGNIAIEKLIERMIELGSNRSDLKAKVFGGKTDNEGESVYNIGQRNIDIAFSVLSENKISIVGSNVGGPYGRKLMYISNTGDVFMKYLKGQNAQ